MVLFLKHFLNYTVQNLKKRLILRRSPQISGQNKSEARELEGLVKITYGIVASSLFKSAGEFKLGKIFGLWYSTCSGFLYSPSP